LNSFYLEASTRMSDNITIQDYVRTISPTYCHKRVLRYTTYYISRDMDYDEDGGLTCATCRSVEYKQAKVQAEAHNLSTFTGKMKTSIEPRLKKTICGTCEKIYCICCKCDHCK
jgi:hypothetical protein